MAVAIATASPGRGRPGDIITIAGSGFSPTFGQNTVTLNGIPAGVNSSTAIEIVVVIPAGLPVDQHVPLVVTNLDDATSETTFWWSQDTIANTEAAVLRQKIPWDDEKLRGLARTIKNMNTAEGRFFERVATKIELVRDLLAAPGNFFSRAADALGLRQALVGTAGQVFVSAVDTIGGQFQDRQCATLAFGRELDGADLTGFMVPGGTDIEKVVTVTQTTFHVVPFAGLIALASMRESVSASSRVNRMEILVNDVVVFDLQAGSTDFPGPGIRIGEFVTFYPGVRVAQGDRVQLRISRNNVTTDVNVLAYLLVA